MVGLDGSHEQEDHKTNDAFISLLTIQNMRRGTVKWRGEEREDEAREGGQ